MESEVWDSMNVSDKDQLQTEGSLSAIAALVKVHTHTIDVLIFIFVPVNHVYVVIHMSLHSFVSS